MNHLASFFLRALPVLFFLNGCATTQPDTQPVESASEEAEDFDDNDPLEPWNRVMFTFNEGADALVINPVAVTYQLFVPPVVQQGITNALDNLLLPLSAINWLLQGQFKKAIKSIAAFCINTVVGLLGLFKIVDVEAEEDLISGFGDTLKAWGVESGPYFVLPLIGPSTFRDSVGLGVSFFMDPLNLYCMIKHKRGILEGRNWAYYLDRKGFLLQQIESERKNSLDFYVTMRSLYLQSKLERRF